MGHRAACCWSNSSHVSPLLPDKKRIAVCGAPGHREDSWLIPRHSEHYRVPGRAFIPRYRFCISDLNWGMQAGVLKSTHLHLSHALQELCVACYRVPWRSGGRTSASGYWNSRKGKACAVFQWVGSNFCPLGWGLLFFGETESRWWACL